MRYDVVKKRVLISSDPEIYMDDIKITESPNCNFSADGNNVYCCTDGNAFYSIDNLTSYLPFIYSDYAYLLLDKERNKRSTNDANLTISIRFVGIFDGAFMNYLTENATSNEQLIDMLDKLKIDVRLYCLSNNITTEPVVAVYATKKEMESVGYFEHSHDTDTKEYYDEQRTARRFMSIKASILAENGFVNKEYSPGIGYYDTYIVFGLPTLSTTLSESIKLQTEMANHVDQLVREANKNSTLSENVLNALTADN